MEYVYFLLVLAFLIFLLVLLSRVDARAKNRQRKIAYHLLEQPDPSGRDIKQALRMLRLYGGRWRKNKEFIQLIARLEERLKNAKE